MPSPLTTDVEEDLSDETSLEVERERVIVLQLLDKEGTLVNKKDFDREWEEVDKINSKKEPRVPRMVHYDGTNDMSTSNRAKLMKYTTRNSSPNASFCFETY